jgi:glycosyltransferase involved in cell wall biosynthesis
MRRVGLFLGVEPKAGGMFQYAQSLLQALKILSEQDCEVIVAYVGRDWNLHLASCPFKSRKVLAGKWGLMLARVLLGTRAPIRFTRIISFFFNPISWHLRALSCDLWIFPAQDAIGYQISVPALVTIHDLMHRYEPNFPEVVKGQRYLIREHRFKNLALYSKGVLVDSEVGQQHVLESYGVDRDKVFPLPFVANEIDVCLLENSDLEKKFKLPKKFLFYPSQFWAHKNHKRMILAAASVKENCPDLHIVFTGALEHEYQKIKDLVYEIKMDDKVTFCGYVKDAELPMFYLKARALVMPTFFGPTNIPPLEALKYSCPMAVSSIYGMPAQLRDAALYMDPNSEESIAQAMEQLWNNDKICQRLKRAGADVLADWNMSSFSAGLDHVITYLSIDRSQN